MKAPCPDREPRLEALLFDDLAPGEREILEAHLVGCAPCREALEDARLALQALGAIDDPPRAFVAAEPTAPDEAWKAFRARVEKTPAPESVSGGRLLALAAVLVLGVAIGWLLAHRGETRPDQSGGQNGLEALVRADLLADAGVRYVDGLRELFSELTELSLETLTVERAIAAQEQARSLLRDGRLLERSLDPERDRHFLRAIGRAELFLEEIAALEPSGENGSMRLLQASLSASRLPSDLARLDMRQEVESALEGSGALANESLYRRKDF
jgi:Putative zinc-finger